jgi:hypothetical protein
MKKVLAFFVVVGLALGIGMNLTAVSAQVDPEDYTDFEELLPLP